MDILAYILIFTLLGSVVSLVGGVVLVFKEKLAVRMSHYLASFAAGALLGTAFLDLFPEAFEEAHSASSGQAGETNIFLWALIGLLTFFLLERYIDWFHHHHEHEKEISGSTVPLVLIGDSLHNFIDGVVIAATFMVSIPLGILTSFAVAAHEIPQEIGDFGILLHAGIKRKKVIFYNLLSALASVAGALLTFYFGGAIEGILPIVLSLTAGFFIYIAASDLIPEIHHQDKRSVAMIQSMLLILGVVVIWVAVTLLEGKV